MNQRTNYLSLILLDALEDENESDIHFILERNSKAIDPSYVPQDRRIAPLHYVCGMQNEQLAIDVTKRFLNMGANPNCRSKDNMTPIHVAVMHGRVEIVRLLLQHDAEIEVFDNDFKSPDLYAIEECKFEIVQIMRDHIRKKYGKKKGDFHGLNYYTSRYVEEAEPPQGKNPSWQYDSRLKYKLDSKWKKAKSNWLYSVPEGLEGLLNWIKNNYNNIEVIITENGWSDDGQLDDTERIVYLKAHLQAVLNAINMGCNVTRYTHWSLIDNFEWQRGYTEKFGLYYVNMSDASRERIEKYSARYYRSVIETKTVPSFVAAN